MKKYVKLFFVSIFFLSGVIYFSHHEALGHNTNLTSLKNFEKSNEKGKYWLNLEDYDLERIRVKIYDNREALK